MGIYKGEFFNAKFKKSDFLDCELSQIDNEESTSELTDSNLYGYSAQHLDQLKQKSSYLRSDFSVDSLGLHESTKIIKTEEKMDKLNDFSVNVCNPKNYENNSYTLTNLKTHFCETQNEGESCDSVLENDVVGGTPSTGETPPFNFVYDDESNGGRSRSVYENLTEDSSLRCFDQTYEKFQFLQKVSDVADGNRTGSRLAAQEQVLFDLKRFKFE
jgi:hypothetical protein